MKFIVSEETVTVREMEVEFDSADELEKKFREVGSWKDSKPFNGEYGKPYEIGGRFTYRPADDKYGDEEIELGQY